MCNNAVDLLELCIEALRCTKLQVLGLAARREALEWSDERVTTVTESIWAQEEPCRRIPLPHLTAPTSVPVKPEGPQNLECCLVDLKYFLNSILSKQKNR